MEEHDGSGGMGGSCDSNSSMEGTVDGEHVGEVLRDVDGLLVGVVLVLVLVERREERRLILSCRML